MYSKELLQNYGLTLKSMELSTSSDTATPTEPAVHVTEKQPESGLGADPTIYADCEEQAQKLLDKIEAVAPLLLADPVTPKDTCKKVEVVLLHQSSQLILHQSYRHLSQERKVDVLRFVYVNMKVNINLNFLL